jgi:hypothetical protein
MVCQLLDGLDWATTEAGFSSAWPLIGTLETTEGRQGGNAFSAAGDNATIAKRNLGQHIPEGRTFYLGWHMKVPSPGNEGGFDLYIRLMNESGQYIVEGESDFQGTGRWQRNNADSNFATGFPYYGALSANTYGRFEIIANFAGDSSSFFQFYINGVKYTDVSNIGLTLGDLDLHSIQWYASAPGGQRVYLDDIVVFDDQGDENVATRDAPLGAFLIETIEATGDGASSQWTPQGGGANYVEIDDTDPDGDTTYVETSTDGNQDLYTFGAVNDARRVYAVEVNAITRLDVGSDPCRLKMAARSGTTTLTTDGILIESEDYSLKEGAFSLDPDSVSAEWDKTSIDAAQFGIEFEDRT